MKFFLAIALFATAASAYVLPAGVQLTPAELTEVQQIMAAIHSPSTDPTTAVMLEQMLFEILGVSPTKPVNIPAMIDQYQPVQVGPAIVDQYQPIQVGPAIVDQYQPVQVGPAIVDQYQPVQVGPAIVDQYQPVQVGPAIVDQYQPVQVGPAIVDQYQPVHVGPALVDFPVPEEALAPAIVAPAAPASSSSPLVQIIVNVNQASDVGAVSPVQVDHVGAPSPVVVVDGIDKPEVQPTPVIVVEEAEESIIKPTPVIVVDEAWVQPEPVIVGHLPEPVNVAPVIVAPAVIAPDTLN